MRNIILLLLLTIHLSKVKGAKPEVYEEDADSLFQSILGEVYTIKHVYPIPNITMVAKLNKTKIQNKYEEEGNSTASNMTSFEYEVLKLKELVQYNESSVPNFEEDVIESVTRRFNDIQTRRKRTVSKDVRPRPGSILQPVNRSISLMEQFVYSTRNRLPYAQLLRKKYNTQLRYKVGFCLALLRSLKQQQMLLYNSYARLAKIKDKDRTRLTNFVYYLMVYEKVVRLDVDIKDVIKLIKKLEKERREEEDPKDEFIADDSMGNSSIAGGLPILDLSKGQNGTRSAKRIGWIDPRALDLNYIYGLRRMNSIAQNPVNVDSGKNNIVEPLVNLKKSQKKSQNRSPLWAPSYKIRRTDSEGIKNFYS